MLDDLDDRRSYFAEQLEELEQRRAEMGGR
jgi:hypothetical protein